MVEMELISQNFYANNPFLFAIRNNDKEIIFMGSVKDF